MTQLDSFQSALLAELRQVVDERTPVAPSRRRRRMVVGLAAAALLAAAAVVVPGLVRHDAAYAVLPHANGSVDVRVDRLEDAAGLERALSGAGIRADIEYLPPGTQCAPGRYRDARPPDPSAGFLFTIGDDGYRVRLDPGALSDTQTLVIAVARSGKHGVHGQIGVAEGRVGPCRSVPAPGQMPLE